LAERRESTVQSAPSGSLWKIEDDGRLGRGELFPHNEKKNVSVIV
jgi:hypothetical protein